MPCHSLSHPCQNSLLTIESQALINSLTHIKILMSHPCLHDFIVAHSTLAHDYFFYSFILVFLVTYLCLSLNCICLSLLAVPCFVFRITISDTSLEICLSLSSLLVFSRRAMWSISESLDLTLLLIFNIYCIPIMKCFAHNSCIIITDGRAYITAGKA